MASSSATVRHNSPPRTGSATFLFPEGHHYQSGLVSSSSTTSSTPLPSRSASPAPKYYHGTLHSSSCASDSDSESLSPLIRGNNGSRRLHSGKPSNWWPRSGTPRQRRRTNSGVLRTLRKWFRQVIRHRLLPGQPFTSVVFILISLLVLASALTFLLIYILNPDKEPLPWRAYCSIPSLVPPRDAPYPLHRAYPEIEPGQLVPTFPPHDLEKLPPAGVLVGVFSVDHAFERRMLIRSTWASHPRSRNGAGEGDGGRGTSRTLVRFILGQPRPSWERQIHLEMSTYNDIVILPVPENMNKGKTHTFFSWASLNAWVPPLHNSFEPALPQFSYSNYTASPPSLAPHDPQWAGDTPANSGHPRMWIRPDFVVKADDDSFIMLAELEARLRLELHTKPKPAERTSRLVSRKISRSTTVDVGARPGVTSPAPVPHFSTFPEPLTDNDPLIYWGYLVTNKHHQFMAGESYALSWSLVDWVAKDAAVKTMTRGAEDKQTAKWMRSHPRADRVRWISERCWIYDHPRGGTVYTHGFLFPSEVARIKRDMMSYLENVKHGRNGGRYEGFHLIHGALARPIAGIQDARSYGDWFESQLERMSHSSVSTFGSRYRPPLLGMTPRQSVEALIEGSEMSKLRQDSPSSSEQVWLRREGRATQYEHRRLGGTVVVHFIKQDEWFLETALALLEGEEESEAEKYGL